MATTVTQVNGPFTSTDLGYLLDHTGVALLDYLGAALSQQEAAAILEGAAATTVLVSVQAATVERVS